MTVDPRIFIGLVTHPRSHFNRKGQATALLESLKEGFALEGVPVSSLVSDRNDFTDPGSTYSMKERIGSAWFQAKLEADWAKYLGASAHKPAGFEVSKGALRAAMFGKRAFKYVTEPKILERLANIDLSHLRLLSQGLASGAEWILIFEDDAQVSNIKVTVSGVSKVMDFLNSAECTFVNLSESIDADQLGTRSLNDQAINAFNIDPERLLLHFETPITNTVCANLYSNTFAREFQESIEREGLNPSIPIDWRLNQLILESRNQPVQCYWSVPGLFVQGSMVR